MAENTSTPRLLSTRQAAALIGVGESTLEKMRVYGNGPKYVKLSKLPRGRVIYDLADVEKWLASLKRSNTSTSTKKAA